MKKIESPLIKEIMASANPVAVKQIETRMLIAKGIYDALARKGITLDELASTMGKAPSDVSGWISGDYNFTIDTLSEIGYHLGLELTLGKAH